MGGYWHKRRGKANGRNRKKTRRIHEEAEALRRKDRDTNGILRQAGVVPSLFSPYGLNATSKTFAEILAEPPPTREEMSAVMDRYFASYKNVVDWLVDMPKPRPYFMHPTTFAIEYMAAGRAYTELDTNVYRIDDAAHPYVIETHRGVREGYATTERPGNVGSFQDDAGGAGKDSGDIDAAR